MDRCALFVDAGYVLGDGAMAVHGTRERESVRWDYGGLLRLLSSVAMECCGLPLLRCYWYEAAVEGRRTSEHDALADLPDLKLRLSRMRPGRREGVDTEINRDLSTLARNRAISDAVVVTAEEDLAQVIEDVQDLGVRVTLMHIMVNGDGTISRLLRQECDSIVELRGAQLGPYVSLTAPAEPIEYHDQSPAERYAGAPFVNGHAAAGGYVARQADRAGLHEAPAAASPAAPAGQALPVASRPSSGHQVPAAHQAPPAHQAPAAPGAANAPSPTRPELLAAPSHAAETSYGAAPAHSGAPSYADAPSRPTASSYSAAPSHAGAPSHAAAPCHAGGPQRLEPQLYAAPTSAPVPPIPVAAQEGRRAITGGPVPGDQAAASTTPATLPSPPPPRPSGGAVPRPGAATAPAPAVTLADATVAAHAEGLEFGDAVARDAPALWLEAVLARKPRMPSDLEARLLQGSALPIDFLLHDEVRHALRRGFWDALERSRR